MLAELDAAYFLLYGIERDDVEYILTTFQGNRRETAPGLFGPAVTVLDVYDRLRAAN